MNKGYGKPEHQHYSFRTGKPKQAHGTDKEAIQEATRLNDVSTSAFKFVAYKCALCHKYHIGKSLKTK